MQCEHGAWETRCTEDRLSVWTFKPASISNDMIKMLQLYYFYKHKPRHCYISVMLCVRQVLFYVEHGMKKVKTAPGNLPFCATSPHIEKVFQMYQCVWKIEKFV